MTGAPGLINWVKTTPLNTSAVCMTSAPIVVTGTARPIISTGTTSTIMPFSTQSIRLWLESIPQRRGLLGQQVKTAIGFSIISF